MKDGFESRRKVYDKGSFSIFEVTNNVTGNISYILTYGWVSENFNTFKQALVAVTRLSKQGVK